VSLALRLSFDHSAITQSRNRYSRVGIIVGWHRFHRSGGDKFNDGAAASPALADAQETSGNERLDATPRLVVA
jgi:hypothetical protein